MDWSTYITDLSIPKAWKYNGYHHDVLPSWYVNGFIIYIDSHLKSERLINSKEWNSCATLDNLNPRFTVFSDNYASGNTLDIPEELLATDNFTEVLEFVSIKDMWKKENKYVCTITV
jgi:hypothetical protein